jgi:hypothetical protein
MQIGMLVRSVIQSKCWAVGKRRPVSHASKVGRETPMSDATCLSKSPWLTRHARRFFEKSICVFELVDDVRVSMHAPHFPAQRWPPPLRQYGYQFRNL